MAPYTYIGPPELLKTLRQSDRAAIRAVGDLRDWCRDHAAATDIDGTIAATWIIDTARRLWLADRHSEHVACARGKPVLAAGELFVDPEDGPAVARISNQSTGYCPDVSSWAVVRPVFGALGIGLPEQFEPACEFRRCDDCGALNLVKDGFFVCLECGADLPEHWNIGNREVAY